MLAPNYYSHYLHVIYVRTFKIDLYYLANSCSSSLCTS